MARPRGRRLTQTLISSSFTVGLLIPYWGSLAVAQTPEETPESELPVETSEPENGETDAEPEADSTTDDPAAEDASPAVTSPRFTCQMDNGQYTVMYSPESQPNQSYAWAIPEDMGSNWPAQRRCNEISARLESYRPDGLLQLQTAIENGYNTVCVTTESNALCRIVFTVPAGQDPITTRNQVFENLTLADSGQQTQGVNTFVGSNSSIVEQLGAILGASTTATASNRSRGAIHLRPFLAPEDGGTGTRLTATPSTGQMLDPESFR